MSLHVRPALPVDCRGIAQVKTAVWPEEAVRLDYIAACIESPEHRCIVAEADGNIVGFVDGFSTLSAEGVKRWEVDLLAVRPDYQGKGIATALLRASQEAGSALQTQFSRGLVQVTNIASQRAFARCGYQPLSATCGLYVALASGQSCQPESEPGEMAYWIQVNALNYRGLWLEGTVTAASIGMALACCKDLALDLVGAVVPLHESAVSSLFAPPEFLQIGEYQWWVR